MGKIAVIGAGAAGIVAALKASERHSVVLLDRNDKCGKKIMLTGNGHCNYWNDSVGLNMYNTDNEKSLENILQKKDEVLGFLEKLSLYPKIKNGYYYPYSGQAASVCEIFKRQLEGRGVSFLGGFRADTIKENHGKFIITSEDGRTVECEKIIIATGSKAYPKTGSTGDGYRLAKAVGHSVSPVLPALCPVTAIGGYFKEWEKIRCDASVKLYVDGKCVAEDEGEIQLTSSGISGICTFNISAMASKSLYAKQNTQIYINFAPFAKEGFYKWFDSRCEAFGDVTVEEALESVFNYKLMFVLLKKAGIARNMRWRKMSQNERKSLCNTIESHVLTVTGTEAFDKAQVCTGGVPLSEIDSATMESLKKKNVYLAGEIMDVDGKCGGYNLAFAFISGYIAGGNV